MTPRESWTDERLDDLKKHMDEGFREVKAELKSTRAELASEIRELRGGLEKVGDRIDRLTYTLIAALVGIVATHYLG